MGLGSENLLLLMLIIRHEDDMHSGSTQKRLSAAMPVRIRTRLLMCSSKMAVPSACFLSQLHELVVAWAGR